jgi:hypothetical protein
MGRFSASILRFAGLFACALCFAGSSGASTALGALAPAASIAAVSPAVPPGAVQVQPALGPALPSFAVVARVPAYTLNSNCSTGGAAITFHLSVSNNGLGSSPAITQDQGGVMISSALQTNGGPGSLWSVATGLPGIPAHGSVPVDVNLMPLSATSLMAGSHVFSVLVNAVGHIKTASTTGDTTNISVNVPAGFCPNMTAGSAARTLITKTPPPIGPGTTMSSTRNNPGATTPVAPGGAQPITPPNGGSAHNNSITHVPVRVQLPTVVASPTNLQYTNDPKVCNAHAGGGLASALICPGLISSTASLPLVWDWQQCTYAPGSPLFNIPSSNVCGVSQPDGFHIYRVTNTFSSSHFIHLGTRALVDTQTTPSMTIRGISPYNKTDCYVVTAYKGSTESADSNEWCGAANLAMGTAWKEVNPTDSPSMFNLPVPCDSIGRPYPLNPDGHEGFVKYDGHDYVTDPPLDCTGDMIYHISYQFDLSALKAITKVVFVAYFNSETFMTSSSSSTTTYPCAITGLMIAGDQSSEIPLQSSQFGVTADITHFFAGNRVRTVSFAHKPDPDPLNPQDTCLSDFKNTHIDVTYFP